MTDGKILLPRGWGLNSFTVHFEGEDPRGTDPFAATMIVQLRMDVRPGASAEAIRKADEANLVEMLAPELLEGDEVDLEGTKVQFLEWVHTAPDLRRLRQLMLYLPKGPRLYAMTATHKADQFERIRADVLAFAKALLAEDGPLGPRPLIGSKSTKKDPA